MQTDLVFTGIHATSGETHRMRMTVPHDSPDQVKAMMAHAIVQLSKSGFVSDTPNGFKLIPASAMKEITVEPSMITVVEGSALVTP